MTVSEVEFYDELAYKLVLPEEIIRCSQLNSYFISVYDMSFILVVLLIYNSSQSSDGMTG
jgi:hypothetical protein